MREFKIRTGVMVRLLEDHDAYLLRAHQDDIELVSGSFKVLAGCEVMVLESFRRYGFNTVKGTSLDVQRGDETFRIITRAPSRTLKVIPTPKGKELADPWVSASWARFYRALVDIPVKREDGPYVVPEGSLIEVAIVRRSKKGVSLIFSVHHPTSLTLEQQHPSETTLKTWKEIIEPNKRS